MELIFRHVVGALILPPGSLLLLLLLGLLLRRRFYRSGQSLIYAALILLWLICTPIISNALIRLYEYTPALEVSALAHSKAKAIVILGGGRYPDAPEYGGDTVSVLTLERIRYGAWLQSKTKLPILVTGGNLGEAGRPAEAVLMQQALEKSFLAVVYWVEKESRNTYENAINSKAMLDKEGIDNVILVTHAVHMPRSIEAFAHAGFSVTPAPLGYLSHAPSFGIMDFLPSAKSLYRMRRCLHELVGKWWYELRYY
jgi:uncharacterized SAM-binding protein YcdF (DUF218 family)